MERFMISCGLLLLSGSVMKKFGLWRLKHHHV